MRHFDPGTGWKTYVSLRRLDAFSRVLADFWEADDPSESGWKFECHELAYNHGYSPLRREKAIWKGSHNPIVRGLTITMVINHLLVLG